MSKQEKTREVIRQLKNVREERGLSIQRIVDMTEANGTPVSLATVRRVFEAGSEERNFRYEDSIKPIVDVLLEVDRPAGSGGKDEAELDMLRAVVNYKNTRIAELEADAANVEAKVQAAKDEAQSKIVFLKEQIKFKEEQMCVKDKLLDERRDFIYRKDRIITVLCILLALCLLLIIGALIADRINPEIGFFWLGEMKSFFANTGNDLAHAGNSIKI